MAADWSRLPAELLLLISQHLHTSIDLLRFRSICHTWRAVAPPSPPAAARFTIGDGTRWGFYLSKRTVYLLQPSIPGQSSWIIKLGWANPDRMHILHPIPGFGDPFIIKFPTPALFDFSNIRVRELGVEYSLEPTHHRPRVNSTEYGYLRRDKAAVLDNGRGGFVILAIHSTGKLMVYKSGDEGWSLLIDDLPDPQYDDIVQWGGRFYGVDKAGRIVVVNSNDLNASVVANVTEEAIGRKAFVGSDRELLILYTCWDDMESRPRTKVHRLGAQKLTEITDLGDKIVFFGRSYSFLGSSVEILGDDKCGGIYPARGLGVYSFKIGCQMSNLFRPPPDWVIQ